MIKNNLGWKGLDSWIAENMHFFLIYTPAKLLGYMSMIGTFIIHPSTYLSAFWFAKKSPYVIY